MSIKIIFTMLMFSGCASLFVSKHMPIRHWQPSPRLALADVAQTPPKLAIDYTDQKPIPKRNLTNVMFKYYTDEELEDYISQQRAERTKKMDEIKRLQAQIKLNEEDLDHSLGAQSFRKECSDHKHRPEVCDAAEKYNRPEQVQVQQAEAPKKVDKGSGLFFRCMGRFG